MTRSRIGKVLQSHLRERVIVTLRSGEAFSGVLYAADEKSWELSQAAALGAGPNNRDVPVDGALVIPVANVAYAQHP